MLAGLKEVVAEGKKRNIAIGSFNTPNLECLLAVLDAAEELNVPVIISHAQCHEEQRRGAAGRYLPLLRHRLCRGL